MNHLEIAWKIFKYEILTHDFKIIILRSENAYNLFQNMIRANKKHLFHVILGLLNDRRNILI